METQLTKVDKLIGEIMNSTDIHALLDFRDKAKAIHSFAKTRQIGQMADKAKEAQIRAEIRSGWWLEDNLLDGRPQKGSQYTTLSEIKVTKDESSRWQKMWREYNEYRKIWEDKIAIIVANQDEELTKAGLFRAVWSAILQTEAIEWWTPKQYIDAVHEVMGGIDLDPASCSAANKIVRAKKYYTQKDDGLLQDWYGRVFLNPPYGRAGPDFIEKLYNEYGSTVSEAIVLINSRATDADWFQPMFEGLICFTDHRVDFDSPHEKLTASTHGSCFIYFGKKQKKFAKVFARFGNVVKRWP